MNSLVIIGILLLLGFVAYFLIQRLKGDKKPEAAESEIQPTPVETTNPPISEEKSAPPPIKKEGTRGGNPFDQPGNEQGTEESTENSVPPTSTKEGTRGGDPFGNAEKELAVEEFEMSPPPADDNTTINVFYGTDRKRTGKTKLAKFYGGERNSQATDGPMEYGICKVSIPPNHKVGNIESPKWWKFEFSPDVKKHVVLQDINQHSKEAFFQKLRKEVASATQQQAFVFVHGYNVTFDTAAKRTAQIAYDLAFDGAPIMYSWPSKGGLKSYTVDESNIQWTKPHLQQFLVDIAESSGATTIHLIAHSMGNRALTRAFSDLVEAEESPISEKFQKVILTAPDIDADVFKQEIAPAMLKSPAHITLYASSNDKALKASRLVHGHPRAGDSGEKLVILPGIDTIDASAANTGLLGHSYFAESVDVISDIFELLKDGERADKRTGLMPKSNDFGDYWEVMDKEE